MTIIVVLSFIFSRYFTVVQLCICAAEWRRAASWALWIQLYISSVMVFVFMPFQDHSVIVSCSEWEWFILSWNDNKPTEPLRTKKKEKKYKKICINLYKFVSCRNFSFYPIFEQRHIVMESYKCSHFPKIPSSKTGFSQLLPFCTHEQEKKFSKYL